MEFVKLTFLAFVEKFFPEQLENSFHKQRIEKISQELIKSPEKTLIMYDGRNSVPKTLLHKYMEASIKIAPIKEAEQNGN